MQFKDIEHGLDKVFTKWHEDNPNEVRYFYRGTEYATLDEAKAAIDQLMGPDVAAKAMDEAKVTDWGKRGTFTDTQRRVVYSLARKILESGGLGERHMAGYEFKQFEITWGVRNSFYLVAEVGRKGDEGSMASIICRDRWHIAVGPRGGCTNLNAARYSKRRKGFHNCVTWGRTSFGSK